MKELYQQTIVKHLIQPLHFFMAQQRSGSIVLAICVLVALLLANTDGAETYFHFLEQKVGLSFGKEVYFEHSLLHWINDGLMSVFFFVVGLELKHEIIGGELANPRQALLPIAAAVGGMLLPAGLYLLLNHGSPTAAGWGIPMATDIAFALGVLYLLGNRVPTSAKVFLTTLAVVDDLGAVLVIALFYTSHIHLLSLGVGLLLLALMFVANRMGVKSILFYGLVGIGGVWTMFLLSGVHATIAAVLAAFMIPSDARLSETEFVRKMGQLAQSFRHSQSNEVITLEEEQVELLHEMQAATQQATPPSQALEHSLAPLVTFGVMPIFALANAGIALRGVELGTLLHSPITWGVALGLLVGKVGGIVGAVWLMVRMGWASLPTSLSYRTVTGLALLAAIGFTMSIFISTLAFTQESFLLAAKVGIFLASLLGGALGYALFHSGKHGTNHDHENSTAKR